MEGPRRVPRGAIKRLLRRGYASKFTGIYSPPISSRTGYVARARVCLTLYESHPTITGRKGERSIAFTKDYLSVMAVRCLMCPVCGRIRAVFSLPITFYGHRYVAARSSRRWKKGWVFFPGPGMHAVTVNASLARAFLSGKLPPAPPPPPPSPPLTRRKVCLVLEVIDSQRHRRTVEIASFFSSAEQLILGKFSFGPPVRRCRNQFQFLRADCRHLNTFPNTSESSRLIAASIEIEIEIVTNNCLLLAQNYIPSRQRVA